MSQNRSSHRNLPPRRRNGFALALALGVAVASGCATTTIGEEENVHVSEAQAKRDLGSDYLSSGRTAMALRELQASLALDDSDPVAHLWLGEAYRRKGQLAKALEGFEAAVELAQSRHDTQTGHDARLSLSALLAQMGRHADALPHCEALANDPTFSSPWRALTNCGWSLLSLGRLDEARAHFDQALEFFPQYGPALLNLGILEAKLGRKLAAVTAFDKAIASGRLDDSALAEVNFRLGEVYVSLGQRERAITHFRTSAQTGPIYEWATQSQAYLDLLR